MKKYGLSLAAAAVVCAAVLLGGCTEYGFYRESDSSASGESLSAPEISSAEIVAAKPLSAGEDLLETAYSNMCLTMYADGSFSGGIAVEEAEKTKAVCALRQMLSDESYKAVKSVYDIFPTKEDYVKSVLELYPDIAELFDESGGLKTEITPALYIVFDKYEPYDEYDYDEKEEPDPEAEKQAFFRTADWVIGKLDDKELRGSVVKHMKKNGYASGSVDYCFDEEGVIDVCARIDAEDETHVLREKFHISGKPGFEFGDTFVLSDTEKLVLSSRDRTTLSIAAGGFIPEGCKLVCPERDLSGGKYDLAEIAEKLPGLKELHIYQADCDNRDAVADMKNLKALSYYVLGEATNDDFVPGAVADCPFKGLKKLRSLRIYADYEDYSFLNEMPWLEDIHVDVGKTDAGFESLFGCPGITSLEINGWFSDMKYDLDGIEKLDRLKNLRVTCESLDFTPLGELPSLEDLYVRCTYAAVNVEKLSGAPKLSKLFLSDFKYVEDWSFLQRMPSLTDLTLYYVPKVRNSDIAPLDRLTSLTLSDTGCNVEVAAELPNLERYTEIMSDGGDFSVFERCTNLRELYLLGCADGVMDCAYVRGAPLEVFCCNGTEVANPELLAEIKTLKSIIIATEEGGIDCGDLLREALPDCEINVDSPAFYHNNV